MNKVLKVILVLWVISGALGVLVLIMVGISEGFYNVFGAIIGLLINLWIGTIVFTIVLAVTKGYNGLLAFLLGLFIPLLGSTIVIALLPNKREMDYAIYKIGSVSSKIETINQTPSQKCKRCGKELTGGYTGCPHCGSTDLINI